MHGPALGIVVEVGLLLCLHSNDALVEVLMVDLCGISSQRQHSRLHTHRLAHHLASAAGQGTVQMDHG